MRRSPPLRRKPLLRSSNPAALRYNKKTALRKKRRLFVFYGCLPK